MNIRTDLVGPVYPIPMPFNEKEEVDYGVLAAYCNFLQENGARTLLMTVGTSRFNLLTRDEMVEANRTIARAKGSAIAIASGPGPVSGSLQENILFAKKAAEAGADALMAVYPERWYGDDGITDFYLRLADASPIGIGVHAQPMRDGFGGIHATRPMGVGILSKIAVHPNIVVVKEENGDRALFEEILASLKAHLPVIGAGGAMRRHMKDATLGARTYLVGVESVVPDVGEAFFAAVHAGDASQAETLAARHEDPFFPKAVEFGWHRALKAALAITGRMPIHERRPFPALAPAEIAELRSIIEACGWL